MKKCFAHLGSSLFSYRVDLLSEGSTFFPYKVDIFSAGREQNNDEDKIMLTDLP